MPYEDHADPDAWGPRHEGHLNDDNEASQTGFGMNPYGPAVCGSVSGDGVFDRADYLNVPCRVRASDADGCGAFWVPKANIAIGLA